MLLLLRLGGVAGGLDSVGPSSPAHNKRKVSRPSNPCLSPRGWERAGDDSSLAGLAQAGSRRRPETGAGPRGRRGRAGIGRA